MNDLAIVRIFHYHNMYANVEYLKFLADATTHQERVIFDQIEGRTRNARIKKEIELTINLNDFCIQHT